MIKAPTSILRLCIFQCALLTICGFAAAQKLPKVQEVSLRAPAHVIIDGKTAEWGNKFQAFNNANQVFYTLANDDDYLYLVVRTTNPKMVQKTMMAGITFTVNGSVDKKDKNHADITFPVMKRIDYQKILRIALKDVDGGTYLDKSTIKDTALKARHLDTLMRAANEQITVNMKMLGIKGITGTQDTLTSIYNEMGIALNARFDHALALTYELAVPLKQLGISAGRQNKFAYHVTLNGAGGKYIYEGGGGSMSVINGMVVRTGGALINQDIVLDTDFWGEYTLKTK